MTQPHTVSSITELPDLPYVAGEREMLDGWLDFQRATLLSKCDGLDDEQLRTCSVPPSSLSLLGLVRHMTEVEKHWFRNVLAGEAIPPVYWTDDNEDGDFDDVGSADVAHDFVEFRGMLDECRRVAAEHPDLEAIGKTQRRGKDVSLRWIYVHMIEEYARHNGHADFLRERIDGVTG